MVVLLKATANGVNIDYSLQHEISGNIDATVENVAVGDATLNFGAYGTFVLDFDDSVDPATILDKTKGEDSHPLLRLKYMMLVFR